MIGFIAAGRLPPPSAWTLTSAANIALSAFISPLREAAWKASASSRSRLAEMGAGAGGELTAGSGVVVDGRRDFPDPSPNTSCSIGTSAKDPGRLGYHQATLKGKDRARPSVLAFENRVQVMPKARLMV